MYRTTHGFALLDLIFVCGIIGLLSGIAVPRMMLAKQAAGSASAIGSMRAISSAEITYALTCGGGFYAPNLTALGTPPPGSNQAFIGGGLGAANTVLHSGYSIQVSAAPYAGAPGACNGLAAGLAGRGFKAAADPIDPLNPRFFGTNTYMQIYENTSTLFATMPEIGTPPAGHPLR
jgi:type II secretory pathway pseudopilin PulG